MYKQKYIQDPNSYLKHFGIKNQKWGLRRFQNEDGTLTPEGKERYGIGERKNKTYVPLLGYIDNKGNDTKKNNEWKESISLKKILKDENFMYEKISNIDSEKLIAGTKYIKDIYNSPLAQTNFGKILATANIALGLLSREL